MTQEQWKKILIGAGLSALGGVTTYVLTVVQPELAKSSNAVLLTIASTIPIAANIIRKMIEYYWEKNKLDGDAQ